MYFGWNHRIERLLIAASMNEQLSNFKLSLKTLNFVAMANKDLVINNELLSSEQKALGLLMCVAQEYQAKLIKSIAHLGISPLQSNILHVLDYGPDDGLTVKQIKALQIEESPNISRALNKLMEKGLIQKNRSLKDQRIVHIQITEAGKKLHKEADSFSVPAFKLDLSEEDIEQLYTILKKL